MAVPSLVKFSPNMDMNTLVNALNQNFNQIQAESRRKVVTDEDGVDRIVIGKLEGGEYGLEVSSAGNDVNSATDGQKIMSSKWMMWKIIDSGETGLIDSSSFRRSGNLSLSATNVGYVSDIIIPIKNMDRDNPNKQAFENRIQLFVRDYAYKDIARSGIYRESSGNWFFIKHEYFIEAGTNYLVIRTIVRWMSGSSDFTPRTMGIPSYGMYWEIANPTRQIPFGGGGAGPTTNTYIYYDIARFDPDTKSFGSIYSYTYNIPFVDWYNRYSIDWGPPVRWDEVHIP